MTRYAPAPSLRTFLERAQTQENANAEVTVSVLDAAESAKYFGVSLARRGIQPVYVRVVNRSQSLLAATSNAKESRSGDPLNLVVIGDFETMLSAFVARWDESEVITPATCWKTVRSFLLSSHYRYSLVSALYLFGRSQDIALQRSRRSINERLHLRLWLTSLLFEGQRVWLGQVSRDIGVRFTYKTWNLTTHRVDPDLDEARDYVIEDLTQAGRVEATSYVDGVGACASTSPRRNLTGDPYFIDGKRAVILLAKPSVQSHADGAGSGLRIDV